MGGVVKMVVDERWGFDESVPMFANTLKSLQGFHRKALQNVGGDFFRKEGCVAIVRHFLHGTAASLVEVMWIWTNREK